MKIEYDYTRTDARIVWVTILYILATGVDKEHYDKGITKQQVVFSAKITVMEAKKNC